MNEHIINLLLEVRGSLWIEKQKMLFTIDRFLNMPPDERLLFAVGRCLNIFFFLDDLKAGTAQKSRGHEKDFE